MNSHDSADRSPSQRAGCQRTYLRRHFHRYIKRRKVFAGHGRTTLRQRKRLDLLIRCQRRKVSKPILRKHRARYRHGRWRRRQVHRERLRQAAYTPYDCGGGVRSAIPCSIMWCESGGSYTAENPSGAYGRYQLMPEWWSHLGRKPTPAEQDRLAHELYAGGAGRSNWVC